MANTVEVATYDPKKVSVILDGKILTGFAADSMIKASKSEDSVTPTVGVQGDVAYSENANESGTVEISLMGTSSSLAYVRELEASRKMFAMSIADANDINGIHISEDKCRIQKMPDISRGKGEETVTFIVFVPTLNVR